MHKYETISKLEVAEVQLFHAIELYLEGEHLISSITLAGASEEILGKLVNDMDKENALETKVKGLCDTHKIIYGELAEPKSYINIKNDTRNELKHKKSMELTKNFEQDATSMIKRAIINYKIIIPGHVKLFYVFEKEMVRRWNVKQSEIT